MTRKVAPGEDLLPHMTAAWFNKTLQPPPNKPSSPEKDPRFHTEDTATFVPSQACPIAERYHPVAVMGRVGHTYDRRNRFVSKEDLTPFNWVIPQEDLTPSKRSGMVVFAGQTYAKVTILDPEHQFVDINLETLQLESSNRGRGVILHKDTDYCLINIGNYSGIPDSVTPSPEKCIGEAHWEATPSLEWELTYHTCAQEATSTSPGDTCRGNPGVIHGECAPLYPTICPSHLEDTTVTACSSGTNEPPVCSSTSTSSTTTSECDCETYVEENCGCANVQYPDGTTETIGNCPGGVCEAPLSDGCNPVFYECGWYMVPPPCENIPTIAVCKNSGQWEVVQGGNCGCGPVRPGFMLVYDLSVLPPCGDEVPCGSRLHVPCVEIPIPGYVPPPETETCCNGPCAHCLERCPP